MSEHCKKSTDQNKCLTIGHVGSSSHERSEIDSGPKKAQNLSKRSATHVFFCCYNWTRKANRGNRIVAISKMETLSTDHMTNLSFSDLLTNFKKEKSDELVGIVVVFKDKYWNCVWTSKHHSISFNFFWHQIGMFFNFFKY